MLRGISSARVQLYITFYTSAYLLSCLSLRYPRSRTSTSTGLSAEECHQVMSKEFLTAVEEQDKGIIKRLFQRN
ncbi:hypothetical protein E2C01_085787 [Portunus trituberculatus]|uniref:Uncharacterized protein n=1 Tax=Portunus trituberculatus TaxID=210409 RepID=A0A5B7J9T9_PORTR|nr:hypothetical protein [Portunus trituberculatus]